MFTSRVDLIKEFTGFGIIGKWSVQVRLERRLTKI